VNRPPRDEKLLLRGGAEDFTTDLHPGTGVEDNPEFVAALMVLARESAARLDGDDLDRAR